MDQNIVDIDTFALAKGYLTFARCSIRIVKRQ